MSVRNVWTAFPGGKQKVFTMSWDDGNDCDKGVVELMRKYGIKGTFNLNSAYCKEPFAAKTPWHRMTMEQCLSLYGDDMEIAIHGACHPDWSDYTPVQIMADVMEDRCYFEAQTGRLIRGSAAPNGRATEDTRRALRSCGIAYCRMAHPSTGLLRAIPADFLELYPTAHFMDENLPELAEEFVDGDAYWDHLWMLYVWGHSYECVKHNSWDRLEQLLQKVSGQENVWYATNLEMVEYIQAFRQLQFGAASDLVRNPTATDVWLRVKIGKETTILRIPAGETAKLPQ